MLPKFLPALRRFLCDEDGPTAVEYAIMLALIVVVCITAIIGIGSDTAAVFSSCDTAIINAESGSGS